VVYVAVVSGVVTMQKVATLGQRVILPCHIDAVDAPASVQVTLVESVVEVN